MADGLLRGLLHDVRRVFGSETGHDDTPVSGESAGVALVYRGPASSPGCPEAVGSVLRRCGLAVTYVGPRERTRLDADSLAEARVYAHPGGDDLDVTWPHMAPHKAQIRRFVKDGGVYLGFCLGAYLAGSGPGFKLLPGDTDQYCTSADSEVAGSGNAVVDVDWRGSTRSLFFQDGPWFDVPADTPGLDVLARYRNGLPAAVVLPKGDGVLGLVGPHPEADSSWFRDAGLRTPRRGGDDLAADLVRTALARAGTRNATH